MVGSNKNINITANKSIKKAHGTIKAVYVTKLGAAGNKITFYNNANADGDTTDSSFYVYTDVLASLPIIDKVLGVGINCVITGGEVLVVYE